MKAIAIALSDIHYHDWPDFGQKESRLITYKKMWGKVEEIAKYWKVNTLLIPGDLVHNNLNIDNYTLGVMVDHLLHLKAQGFRIIAISGNHDQCEVSSFSHESPSYTRTLSRLFTNFENIDRTFTNLGDRRVYGIPYVGDPDSFIKLLPKKRKGHILLMHQTLPGSVEGNDFRLESSFKKTIFQELSKFGLVLNGHIHKHQIHTPHIVTVGATNQQRTSDMGVNMGALVIREDLSYRFVPLDMPEFIHGESDGYNLGIPKPREVKAELEVKPMEFSTDNSREVIVENYLKRKKIKSPLTKKLLIKYLG